MERSKGDKTRWRQNNKVRVWALQALDKHRRHGHDVRVTIDDLIELARITTICLYCKKILQCDRTGMASLDRMNNEKILTDDNIQIICCKCNFLKGNRTHSEFMEYCNTLTPNDVFEVLAIAKSKDGILRLKDGKEITMLDENRQITFGYVDSNNKRKERKISIDGVSDEEEPTDSSKLYFSQ
jgi:hypothetical protein